MSLEYCRFVLVPQDLAPRVMDLDGRARSASQRAESAPPGERLDFHRCEAIRCVIEQLAIAAVAGGATTVLDAAPQAGCEAGGPVLSGDPPSGASLPEDVRAWLAGGAVVIQLRLPHARGETLPVGEAGSGPPPPQPPWRSSHSDGRGASRERFETLLLSALDEAGGAIRPSDVSNTVLTESLRKYVDRDSSQTPTDVRVCYRDGSEGPPFPLRALRMYGDRPTNWRELRLTLMSIRHVDMDSLVDGAWLRNTRVSRHRPEGDTDQLVYETSLRQLTRLSDRPTLLCLFQTGLQPAVIGFYRAVTESLLIRPDNLAVLPFYFRGHEQFDEGTLWRAR